MIVVDTSAWVEFLRGSDHPIRTTVRTLLERRADIAVTEVVVMELLSGVHAGPPVRELRSKLLAFPVLRLEGLADFEEAALIYRTCRDAGSTLRGKSDCLIAVPAIRHRASLLHNDRDYEIIARHTTLKLHVARA